MRYSFIFGAAALVTGGFAKPDQVPGMKLAWYDDFSVDGPIDTKKWQYYGGKIHNGEQQTYPKGGNNCKVSNGFLHITPTKEGNEWKSCRIETRDAWAPAQGGKVMFASKFAFGSAQTDPAKLQGIWPAFWALGDSMRHGTPWPDCGEIDTFESVSGKDMAYGTLHCKNSCNEPMGRQYKLDFKRGEDIVWAHVVSPDSIEWFKNGQSYHIVKKSDLSPEDWAAVGTKAFYITLNVATGGGWPGPVNDQTIGGKDAALKVKWVAVYKSA